MDSGRSRFLDGLEGEERGRAEGEEEEDERRMGDVEGERDGESDSIERAAGSGESLRDEEDMVKEVGRSDRSQDTSLKVGLNTHTHQARTEVIALLLHRTDDGVDGVRVVSERPTQQHVPVTGLLRVEGEVVSLITVCPPPYPHHRLLLLSFLALSLTFFLPFFLPHSLFHCFTTSCSTPPQSIHDQFHHASLSLS
jgi:hypothetical protein